MSDKMLVKDIVAGKKFLNKAGEERTQWVNVGTYSDKVDFEIVKKGVKLILPKPIAAVWSEKADKVGAKIKA